MASDNYFQFYHHSMRLHLVPSFMNKCPSHFEWIAVFDERVQSLEDLFPYKLKNETNLSSITYDQIDNILYGYILKNDEIHLERRIVGKSLIQGLKDVGVI